MKHIEKEIEVRSLLDEDKYLEIVSDFVFRRERIDTHDFINHYFDTDELTLKDNHITLRLRETSHDAILTLKISHSQEEAIEVNQGLTIVQKAALLKRNRLPKGNIKLLLRSKGFDLSEIRYNSFNKVRRFEIKKNDHIIALDKCVIKNDISYDIEVEGKSLEIANRILKELSQTYDFKISESYQSKSKRTLIKK